VGRARQAEERYRALFENATDTISVLTPEGIIVEANRRWEDVLQISPAQMIGRHIGEMAAGGHESANTAVFRKLVGQGAGRDEAVPLKRADGTTAYVEFAVNVLQLDGQSVVFSIGR